MYHLNGVRWEIVLLEYPNYKSVSSVSGVFAVLVMWAEPLTHSICASTTVEVVRFDATWMSTLAHASNFVVQVSPAIEFPEKLVTVRTAVIHLEDGKLSWFACTSQFHRSLRE